jgi:hypothetical protein
MSIGSFYMSFNPPFTDHKIVLFIVAFHISTGTDDQLGPFYPLQLDVSA